MKRISLILALIASVIPEAYSKEISREIPEVQKTVLSKDGGILAVSMDIVLKSMDVPGNRAVLLTPVLVDGSRRLTLESIGVYGRRRYIYYQRENNGMLSGSGELTFRSDQKPDVVSYRSLVPWEDWMEGASLRIEASEYGCCHTRLGHAVSDVAVVETECSFADLLHYLCPEAEKVKRRSLSGHAYIDFPVNGTTIFPDYRDNASELAKITATIDSVKHDGDLTIKSISIRGYASPESPYSNNEKLAGDRTEALKRYVTSLCDFPESAVLTSYVPEDWDGLRKYVENSSLAHREEILALIDSGREPDNKEWVLKSVYPEEYKFLLHNVYPALRHSDYKIDFEIRGYSDIAEIRHLVKNKPQNLSLNEFYLAAQSYDPGSEDFNEVFETAVRMYPDDRAANLNAANSAMAKGDLKGASRYLSKAGHSPEATYAKGIYEAMCGNNETAMSLFRSALDDGFGGAADAIEKIGKYMNN